METFDPVLWAARALSIFNTVSFTWLGLAVLLNAERRVLGTWVAGAGLLLGGGFFAFHSIVVGGELDPLGVQSVVRSRLPWLLFIVPSYMWYLVMIWYAGALDSPAQRLGALSIGIAGLVGLALVAFSSPLSGYETAVRGGAYELEQPPGTPGAVLAYPAYSVLCYSLGLLALRRPAASHRLMGDLGRRRATPWVVAATVALLAVSLLVAGAAVWFMEGWGAGWIDPYSPDALPQLLHIDLAVLSLLALALVLLGRAVVSYEIFTGKVLPRGGFLGHWRNSLALAAACGVLMSTALGFRVEPAYQIAAVALLVAGFYALLGWRSHLERERDIQRLRPFVASQRLYERIVAPTAPLDTDLAVPLRALCEQVLDARSLHLVPLGPTLPLAGEPLGYPAEPALRPDQLADLAGRRWKPGELVVPLNPVDFAGCVWAVPLWSERGLVGALLMGEKRDGSLYVQEEIETARVMGERFIDTLAGSAVARRLMQLQRRQLAESQLLDRRARRVLHDDVLPELHAAILSLSGAGSSEKQSAVKESLGEAHRRISDLLRETPAGIAPEVAKLGPLGALRQLVKGELADAFDGVSWEVDPHVEAVVVDLPPLAAEVVYGAAREALRNAAHHGRGGSADRSLHLRISARLRDGLWIEIEDNGVGFGTGAVSGRGSGQGLTLHGAMMAVAGGALSVEAAPDTGTRIVLTLPMEQPRIQ